MLAGLRLLTSSGGFSGQELSGEGVFTSFLDYGCLQTSHQGAVASLVLRSTGFQKTQISVGCLACSFADGPYHFAPASLLSFM